MKTYKEVAEEKRDGNNGRNSTGIAHTQNNNCVREWELPEKHVYREIL